MCNRLWLQRADLLRAMTALFMLWFSLQLMYGMVCITTDEFYRFFYFLRKPLVMIFNAMTLLSAVLHTLFWFSRIAKVSKSLFNNIIAGSMVIILLVITFALSMQLLTNFSL